MPGLERRVSRDAFNAGQPVLRVSAAETKVVDEARRAVRFCFSDGSVDRVGDTIDAGGWDTGQFLKNPVALWAHDSSSPPIGRASNLAVENGRLMGDIEFMPAEMSGFADTIYRMVVGKYINAVSVGFMPLEYEWSNDDDRPFGLDFKRQELLEISVCPVPANANALAEARAKGIDIRPLEEWVEKLLDGGGKVIVPRTEIERLRKAAAPATTKFADLQRSIADSIYTPAEVRAQMERPAMATKKPTRKDDGMREDDPSSGGAAVATCGRSADEECGMNDPEECSIHRTKDIDGDDDENKRIGRIVARAVAKAMKQFLPKLATKAEGDEDDPDHVQEVKAAHFHMKMMRNALDSADDHHDEAMKCLRRAMKAMDDGDDEPDDKDAGDPDPDPTPDPDPEKAAAKAKVKRLLAAVA